MPTPSYSPHLYSACTTSPPLPRSVLESIPSVWNRIDERTEKRFTRGKWRRSFVRERSAGSLAENVGKGEGSDSQLGRLLVVVVEAMSATCIWFLYSPLSTLYSLASTLHLTPARPLHSTQYTVRALIDHPPCHPPPSSVNDSPRLPRSSSPSSRSSASSHSPQTVQTSQSSPSSSPTRHNNREHRSRRVA